MFVKVVRPIRSEGEASIENVYECDQYETRFWPHEIPNKCLITMRNQGKHAASVEIERVDTAVYFMNNSGKTIDSIDWLDHRVDVAPVPKNS